MFSCVSITSYPNNIPISFCKKRVKPTIIMIKYINEYNIHH